jgi:hypothetical protein
VKFKSLFAIFQHPLTKRTRRIARAIVVTFACAVAVVFVTSVTVDLGPTLRARAETAGTNAIKRPMHIGRLAVHLWRGSFVVEDLTIEGMTPKSRPFLVAKRIDVSMPWSTLITRRIVFDAIQMTDWDMYVELFPDGSHNFPKFTTNSNRPKSSWTTTLEYVRASRGQFTYEDHGTPWSTIARNLDVTVSRPASDYRGQAHFSNGTVVIQSYVPMRADMATSFHIVDGKIVLDSINLRTDGAQTQLTGIVDATRWPEQIYRIKSKIDFPTEKGIWFAHDKFTVAGTGDFTGTFHLFKEQLPDGKTRTGRELKGDFVSAMAGVNAYRFANLRGSVLWVPDRMEVTNATATLYGGSAKFSYKMAPFGVPGMPAQATFDASYANVDLTTFTNVFELKGIRLAGRATGRNLLEWPLGEYALHRGNGELHVEPSPGTELMSLRMPIERIEAQQRLGRMWGPFDNTLPTDPIAVAATIPYAFDADGIDLGPSRFATPSTYVEFEGRTAYGDNSRIPFHVSSADWQESDRLLAGLMTAFGSSTNAIPIAGYGTFDGVMLNSFSRPRIEGTFAGERMRAFDVEWGAARGSAVIENSYADVKEVVIRSGDSEILADGLFSVGYPRRDNGEEINARIRITRRPLNDLRHAFELDDYPLEGLLSGEFHVYGPTRARMDSARWRLPMAPPTTRPSRPRRRVFVSKAEASASTTSLSSKAADAAPAPPTSAGTARINSTSMCRGFPLRPCGRAIAEHAAAVRAAGLHRRRQRHVRRRVRRARRRARLLRRRRRHRHGYGRHQHRQRRDGVEAGSGIASPGGLGIRHRRAQRGDGRRPLVQRGRHVARPVSSCVRSAASPHHCDRERQHPRGGRAGGHRSPRGRHDRR